MQVFENSAASFTSNDKSVEVTVTYGLATTNSANIVVRTLLPVAGQHPLSAPAIHSQRRDCAVSKSTRHSTPCYDDSD